MTDMRLLKEAVLRIGEVTAVTGRRIIINVDKDKNLSELFFDGDILRNIAVGSYIEVRKGFLSLIGKVEGENAQFDGPYNEDQILHPSSHRLLSVSLVGFIDRRGQFFGGTKELPLVGNEAFLLTREKVHQVHNLVAKDGIALHFAQSEYEGYKIALPVDGLMNSHIAIFGNTGSGKSNTLAILYQTFIREMRGRNSAAFEKSCKIVLFDFNGEYTRDNCLTKHKHVYTLSTRLDTGNKLPLTSDGLLDIEMLSILADATEKTQKPFLKRALRLHSKVFASDNSIDYIRNILRLQVTSILKMSDKIRADLLIDYLRQILPEVITTDGQTDIASDLDWNNKLSEFMLEGTYLKSNPNAILKTFIYKHVDKFEFVNEALSGEPGLQRPILVISLLVWSKTRFATSKPPLRSSSSPY